MIPDLATARSLPRVMLPDLTDKKWAKWWKGGLYADVNDPRVQEWAYLAKRLNLSWTQIMFGNISEGEADRLARNPGSPEFDRAKVFRSSTDAMKAAARWLKAHPELP